MSGADKITARLAWTKPDVVAKGEKPENFPSARSGHSLTVVGSNAYVFGGIDNRRPPGPNNELFLLKIGSLSSEWSRVKINEENAPPPRWKHTATLFDPTLILFFGGYHSSNLRFNDVWVYNTVSGDFYQPVEQQPSFTPRGTHAQTSKWPNQPCPRGGHAAAAIDVRVYIFGGYGGFGYSRRELDDMHVLDTETWKWSKVSPKGTGPEKRSGHAMSAVENRLYVFGGWNSTTQFRDMHVLDFEGLGEEESPTWMSYDTAMRAPRWDHASCAVMAIPNWKVFVFGGVTGPLSEQNKQGEVMSDISVLDTGSNIWTTPEIHGEGPHKRSGAQLAYNGKESKLVVFGGWQNQWFSDIHVLDVSRVVGPPYAIMDIYPSEGAITGGTEIEIGGIDFINTTDVIIRFQPRKGNPIDIKGEFVDQTTLTCVAPNATAILAGGGEVDVRVALNGDSFTTTFQKFSFFSVTNCDQCIMYGPGILSGCAVNEETMFIIQARDNDGHRRTTGGDEFTVTIRLIDGAEDGGDLYLRSGVHIQDMEDGTYIVTYIAPQPGEYVVEAEFMGTFDGVAGPVRGSPSTAVFEEFVPRDNNTMGGKIVMNAVRKDLKFLSEFGTAAAEGIRTRIRGEDKDGDATIMAIVAVKEQLNKIGENRDTMTTLINRSDAILTYLTSQGVNVNPLISQLKKGREDWDEVLKEVPAVNTKINPLIKTYGARMKQEIQMYEQACLAYTDEMMKSPFRFFQTGAAMAQEQIAALNQVHEKEVARMEEKLHVANLFDCQRDMASSTSMINNVGVMLEDFTALWKTAEEAQMWFEECAEMLWADIDPDGLEENAKTLVGKVKKQPKEVKESDAFMGLEKFTKDFLNTCPIIVALRSDTIRDRHWEQLMEITKKEFDIPNKNPEFQLREFLDLRLVDFALAVEEITEKAAREAKHEETLVNLEATWETVVFVMVPYKDTDVPLLKMNDEDVEMLESDLLTLSSMVTSRYTQFKKQSSAWQTSLTNVGECYQLLSEMQRMWSYLEPLFIGSEEVKKELPEDTARFKAIDVQVKEILASSWDSKKVRKAFNVEGLQGRLEALQADQEKCKKSLADFLDGKRRIFPRFYFTSEADLLDILSNGSRPEKIMKHIDKVYLATKELKLEIAAGTRPKALTFVAGVGVEATNFDPPVPLEGKVEIYMQTLLTAQNQTLMKCLKASWDRFPQQKRVEWLMDKYNAAPTDPAQVVLLVAGITTVIDTETKMQEVVDGDPHAMTTFQEKQVDQLKDLILLTTNDLSKADRQRVMCMITLDAHTRDVMAKLNKAGVIDTEDFLWKSQLKQRYTELEAGMGASSTIDICDASFEYGFEYLGNGPRLVVTPLTDRIYVTATQALNLKMGCAPAGPAGTGKTESTKDLASALGKCCYVFNCSPEHDYQSLGNIFKGLASSGSWGCFDEFNRLVPEVLSVCSVQFKAVCDGNKAFNKDDPKTAFVKIEGDMVKLDTTCGAFITMNPGYLGRSALPEGLKALFRPMTVMVPDLVLICENLLMAEGYVEAKILASKFYGLYSLLSELLSKQEHYDWGLRAIKSVLVVAGGLKRAEPDLKEQELLMRALRDFNIAKIVSVDQLVFSGLLNDLFPGLDPKVVQDPDLVQAVDRACEDSGLWPSAPFSLKCVQLEELLAIRHCVFVMGPAASGKSSCWQTLLAARNIRYPDNKTKVVDLNPKTVPTEDLYGHISLATREWKDGLLSVIMRDLGNEANTKPKWIVLDGDLDANWIESMNSVMDDNKMLTLASNERIPLKAHMRMVFEIRDLKYATPATVSRAGIIFISTDGPHPQWKNLVASWVQTRDDELYTDENKDLLQKLFRDYVGETLKFMKKNVKSCVPVEDVTLVTGLLRMLESVITAELLIDPIKVHTTFVFCAIWAFGSALTVSDGGTDNRAVFNEWWRAQFKTVRVPARDQVFDYWLDPNSCKFEAWKQCPVYKHIEFDSRSMKMSEVTVPTTESASVTFWLQNMVKTKEACMLAGPAGTGKTQLINGVLRELNPDKHQFQTININFYTSSIALLGSLEGKLQKRTGSTYGPPGSAKLIYFVDDLNLPEVDKYNTQSAIALIRQHQDYGHWYDLQKMTVKSIADTQYVAALNPSAGSFEINPRLQRHFTTIAVSMPSATSLLTIYQTFLDGHLMNNKFQGTVCALSSAMIKGALALQNEVSTTFRKTAANFHYEFNIRHLANVFQGLLNSTQGLFDDPEKFVTLWLHESQRVYADRLVNNVDIEKFQQILGNHAKKAFPQFNLTKFFMPSNAGGEALVFAHFMDPTADEPLYDKVKDMETLKKVLDDGLAEYNETHAAMDLVLFEDAILHVCRVSRIISQPAGHAMLVGVGGSGKQSLSRLSAHMCGYTVSHITITSAYSITDLKGDLQTMYFKAGVKQDGVLFLFTDNQITDERFLVYMNDLLASARIPDLYSKDEKDNIANMVMPKVKALGIPPEVENCWEYFVQQVRSHLHVALCFSPVGPDMRNRAKKFPALVNCTTIDWFQPWPEDALNTVAEKFIGGIEFSTPMIRQGVEQFMPMSFLNVQQMSAKFFTREGRHVYSTPKSYLELLKLYGKMLGQKRDENDAAVDRLKNGNTKLKEASDAVAMLQSKLETMMEEAEEKRTKSEEIAERVKAEKEGVEVETAKANVEAEKVAEIQTRVEAEAADAQKDLAAAEPAIKSAMSALDTLDKKDLGNCRTMTVPPEGVLDVFNGVLVLMAKVMASVPAGKNGKVRDKDRSWETVKKILLGNVNAFIDELKAFKGNIDTGNVPEVNFKEVRIYLAMEHFNEATIMKKNSAAAGLCAWVVNIVTYYDIWRDVEPKRMKLQASNDALAEANEKLAKVQQQVDELNAQLARLQTQFDQAEAAKKEAEETAERGKLKLDLASRLIAALGSEGARWTATVTKLEAAKELLDGDVLLASAFISYIGPFTKEYREELISSVWTPFLEHAAGGNAIPMTHDASPLDTLAREADVAEWNTQGLPFDPVSSENGAIVCRSVRWPLIIDPQLQGIAWLKKMESPAARHLALLRLGSPDLIPKLTKAIENGWTVIIENIGERIDAVLMPVLARTLLKRGSNMYVQVGDQEIEFSPNFQLYLHTKLSNPHYPPEIQAELTLVNFTVTPGGLEDQLLSLVVRKERPDLASKKAALVQQANKFMITIRRLEDEILMKLANAEGDITEDVSLIEGLESAKKQTDDAAVKLEEGRATTEDINTTSEKYRSVARQGSLLFFIMNSLHRVHTYYIYSLNAFVVIFQHGIELVKKASDGAKAGGKMSMMAKLKSAAKQVIQTQRFHWGTDLLHGHSMASDDDHANVLSAPPVAVEELTDEQLELRCTKLKDSITTVLYNYMRRGLFERDKLTVASMLTFSVLEDKGELNHDVLEALMQDKSDSDPVSMTEELEKWLPLVQWRKLKCIEDALGETVPVFQDLSEKVSSAEDEWHAWYDLEAPETEPLPGGKEMAEMNHVEKLVILRALRADRVTFALKHFINDSMGSSFVTQPTFDMKGTYQEASASTPIFFVLFPGVDPTPWVEELGASFEVSTERGNFVNISMGQGQEKPAEATLERMAEIGGWVMLQNVHLMQSWLPTFERKLELASEHAHPSFRCFISAEPPPTAHMKNVPEALLQSCIKVANEAPADLKSNMRRSWATFSHERIAESDQRVTFQGCLFGLCYFHSVMLGRKKFGQQGWSRSYGFNTGDLEICANVLQSYLESYESGVPWQDLRYLFGEIFYGGHITDFWDRRTNVTYLEVIFREATLLESEPLPHKFAMPPPGEMNYTSYSEFIEQTLPTEAPPPLMGLHPNAEIGYLSSTTNELFTLILRLRAGSESEGGGGADGLTALREILEDLHERLPKVFDMVDLNEKAAPLLSEEGSPYVLVALQECTRMNLLLSEIDLSLENLRKGLNGQLNMSQSMEDLMENLSFNTVPGRNPFHACSWERLAWPSLKNLSSWFADLVKRVEELGVWVGVPDRPIKLPYSIWISMLFNSTAFLTAVKQVTARKEKMALDNMTVETHVTLSKTPEELDEKYPNDGCFIHGLFMQGARWPDKEEAEATKEDIDGTIVGGVIMDSRLKDLLPAMPVMYVRAIATKPEWDATSVGYIRPDADVYNCPVYNSTFRGTFVFLATLKTKEPTSTWVLGGVALIMQTDD